MNASESGKYPIQYSLRGPYAGRPLNSLGTKELAAVAKKSKGFARRSIAPMATLLSVIGVISPLSVFAQSETAAAIEQAQVRQVERDRVLREQQQAKRDVRLDSNNVEGAQRIPDETPCAWVAGLALSGEEAGRFEWALAHADAEGDPATGRCLGPQGIAEVVRRVQNAIVARGYVTTRVIAAPQSLAHDVLTLTLVPGRVGAIRFAEDSATTTSLAAALPVRTGDLLNLRAIEQGLENLKHVPTTEARIRILPAQGEASGSAGLSDLEITWSQRQRLRANVSLEDSGLRATGKLIASATVSLDNLARHNDLFYASASHDVFSGSGRGSRNLALHYDVPFGNWLLAANASGYDYAQPLSVQGDRFRFSGEGRSADLRLSRLLHRDALGRTSAYARAWKRDSDNALDDTEILVQRRRMAGWEAGIQHRRFIGQGTLDATLAYRRGTGAFGARPVAGEEQGLGTSRPQLFTAQLQYAQPFRLGHARLRYSGYLHAQWNRTALVIQDRLALGGRYSVRGFDGNTSLIGDRGWFLRNDIAMAIGAGQEFYVGLDYGHVGAQSADAAPLGDHLAGAALGLRGGVGRWRWDAFVGTPIDKPAGFPTDAVTTGFNVGWNY